MHDSALLNMVAPRRAHPSSKTASPKCQRQRQHEHKSRTSINRPAQSERSLGMSPTSRYNYNLKVLRRRDPSIVSIFDQFSHVCVYHHNGNKWEKQGYEGSMFLYERRVFIFCLYIGIENPSSTDVSNAYVVEIHTHLMAFISSTVWARTIIFNVSTLKTTLAPMAAI
jgi:hypothetical protein